MNVEVEVSPATNENENSNNIISLHKYVGIQYHYENSLLVSILNFYDVADWS